MGLLLLKKFINGRFLVCPEYSLLGFLVNFICFLLTNSSWSDNDEVFVTLGIGLRTKLLEIKVGLRSGFVER